MKKIILSVFIREKMLRIIGAMRLKLSKKRISRFRPQIMSSPLLLNCVAPFNKSESSIIMYMKSKIKSLKEDVDSLKLHVDNQNSLIKRQSDEIERLHMLIKSRRVK